MDKMPNTDVLIRRQGFDMSDSFPKDEQQALQQALGEQS